MKKILIVDDNQLNQISARQTIDPNEYELTVVGSVDEAMDALHCVDALEDTTDRYRYASFASLKKEVDFDIVLTDLMLPISKINLSDRNTEGLAAYGFPIALRALTSGVKCVGIVSDTNHHTDPMASIADVFRFVSTAGSSKLLCTYKLIGVKGTVCKKCGGDPNAKCWYCEKTGLERGKDWGAVLKILLGEKDEEC